MKRSRGGPGAQIEVDWVAVSRAALVQARGDQDAAQDALTATVRAHAAGESDTGTLRGLARTVVRRLLWEQARRPRREVSFEVLAESGFDPPAPFRDLALALDLHRAPGHYRRAMAAMVAGQGRVREFTRRQRRTHRQVVAWLREEVRDGTAV